MRRREGDNDNKGSSPIPACSVMGKILRYWRERLSGHGLVRARARARARGTNWSHFTLRRPWMRNYPTYGGIGIDIGGGSSPCPCAG